jgi:hypothetical protein
MASMSLEVFGIRETLAEIRDVDKDLFFKIRAQMKRGGDTLGRRIEGKIPLLAPTRGFRNHSGRTAWQPATTKTTVSGRNARRGQTGSTPLLSVTVNGAAVSIADMAGRGGAKTKRKTTRSYAWRGTRRTHTINGQTEKMLQALGLSPSRYIYPEVEASRPFIQSTVLMGVEQYTNDLNRKFEVIGS